MNFGAITGVLSSRNSEKSEYYTSALYPLIVDENLAVGNPSPLYGSLWGTPADEMAIPNPTVMSGALTVEINYVTQNPTPDELAIPTPAIVSGSLVSTVNYVDVTPNYEELAMPTPVVMSGSLVTTVNFVDHNYNNGIAEDLAIPNPTVISGSLT